MAPPPVPGFDYNGNLKNWTKKTVLAALGPSHDTIVTNLFGRAKELCISNNLTAKNNRYKGEKGAQAKLDDARGDAANTLVSEFGSNIQINGHPDWARMMCLGVIKYQAASGMPSKTQTTPSSQKSQSVVETSIESSPGSSSIANLTSLPSSSPQLVSTHFALNVLPARIGIGSIRRKFILRNLSGLEGATKVEIAKLELQALRDILQAEGMYTSDTHTLQYRDGESKVALVNDRDFQNAIFLATCFDRNSLDIHVDEPEDLGTGFYLLSCDEI